MRDSVHAVTFAHTTRVKNEQESRRISAVSIGEINKKIVPHPLHGYLNKNFFFNWERQSVAVSSVVEPLNKLLFSGYSSSG